MSGDLRARVLGELGVCPFRENINDASMCSCGLPALTHDEMAARIVLNDHPAILALLDERDALAAKVARVQALADEWERQTDAIAITYQDADRRQLVTAGQRRNIRDLRAALKDHP